MRVTKPPVDMRQIMLPESGESVQQALDISRTHQARPRSQHNDNHTPYRVTHTRKGVMEAIHHKKGPPSSPIRHTREGPHQAPLGTRGSVPDSLAIRESAPETLGTRETALRHTREGPRHTREGP